eukprot:575264-Rhodomonas_salina.1
MSGTDVAHAGLHARCCPLGLQALGTDTARGVASAVRCPLLSARTGAASKDMFTLKAAPIPADAGPGAAAYVYGCKRGIYGCRSGILWLHEFCLWLRKCRAWRLKCHL